VVIQIKLALHSSDPASTIAFYCEDLGLFDQQGSTLVCKRDAAFAIDVYRSASPAGTRLQGYWPLLTFMVDDFANAFARLTQRGVPFEGDVLELPYGRQLICLDPEGNRICLVESGR
jgi:predicted enzyme related to lactoylglutathione lyase